MLQGSAGKGQRISMSFLHRQRQREDTQRVGVGHIDNVLNSCDELGIPKTSGDEDSD